MIKLYKVQGSENKFILLDQTTFKTKKTISDLIKLTKKIAHSALPVNNIDGMLVVDDSTHQDCLGKMTVINKDGSLASMCGNGIRTVGRYLFEKKRQNQFKIETLKKDLSIETEPSFAEGVPAYGVEISPIKFDAESLPFFNLNKTKIINAPLPELNPTLKFTAVSVPNPHLISFVPNLKAALPTLKALGEKLNRTNQYFPKGVNISFSQIIDNTTLFVKTYERGVGFTNACGTGMSATTLAYMLSQGKNDLLDHVISVYNPGGMVKTVVHRNNSTNQYWVELIGNATVTDQIVFEENDLFNLNNWVITSTGEELSYQDWIKRIPKVL